MDSSNSTTAHSGGSLVLAALPNSLLARAFFTILAICVCTRVVSSYRYRSIKYGQGRNVAPPTIPYWIPGLRHALSLALDNKHFLARCFNKYGDGTPFFLDGAGEKMLFVHDPEHVKTVLMSAQHFDPNPFVHDKILGALMDSPQKTIDYYNTPGVNTDYIQITHIRQHTTGSRLSSLDKRMFDLMKQSVQQALEVAPGSEWKNVPDLFEFLTYHVTRAILVSILGSSLVDEYPQLVDDLWKLIEATPEFFMGLPRFAMPKNYAARDRLLVKIREYSVKSEELRKSNQADTKWDPVAGSGLLQEREKMYSEFPDHDVQARASQTLGLMYGGTSLVVPVTFWYLFEILRDPKMHAYVSSEIEAHAMPESGMYNFMQLATCPLIQSLHAEATRLYSSNLAVRQVISPVFNLDDKYTVTKGTDIYISHKFNAQFSAAWAQARPNALERPLDVFWAERFLVDGKGGDKKETFSDAGLSGNWTSYGGGEHKCPGRHFARHIGLVTLAILMGEYEIEMVNREAASKAVPPIKKAAWGTMKPTGKVGVRIRKRKA
ncbi:hypothetical protein COCMIDRAFT_106960 [Bipolaris oryzae ATCC 44560]|uniref:Cytochrome P450 n=1 Tax=Bipolaris oryzae ATCC 44560 TaxID=930090 RepID=W6YUC9_COCMI|nr:uncharacterized protein COCMIDRAFT_106960 [Bipolaris oryzae ATCC 44560]EUC41133.1 hypothetical protein COCMIDRAFT_106960 [Bipolaris oryzae ATCC 44560]